MKRAFAVVAGVVVGIVLAGPMVAFLPWLPAPLRNGYVLWSEGVPIVPMGMGMPAMP